MELLLIAITIAGVFLAFAVSIGTMCFTTVIWNRALPACTDTPTSCALSFGIGIATFIGFAYLYDFTTLAVMQLGQ